MTDDRDHKKYLFEILQDLKEKSIHTSIHMRLELLVYIIMFFFYIGPMMERYGWTGIIIVIATFFGLSSLSRYYRNAKKHSSNDIENENVQINKKGFSSKILIIMIVVILLIFSPLFVGFHTYFVNPEITITSPRSGDVIKIDKNNVFLKISGNSKGFADNPFLHLFILHRRVNSSKMPDKWNYDLDYMFGPNSCTVYKDGSWECLIRLDKQCAEWVNGTLVVKSLNNSSSNISANIDIVAIITKQSITHSIFTKLETGTFGEINEIFDHSWYKRPILFWLALGKGTFHDENYDLSDEKYELSDEKYELSEVYCDLSDDQKLFHKNYELLFDYDYGTIIKSYYPVHFRSDPNRFNSLITFSYNLPKHLTDAHVTIIPTIAEPFNITGGPHGLLVGTSPEPIPADNVTISNVWIQLIDSAGNWVQSEGRIIYLTSNLGNLSATNVTTNSKGEAFTYISSGELGQGSILAKSLGLNNGTCQITYTLPNVVVEFNQWIMSSLGDNKTSKLTANFQTMHDAEYYVVIESWGTEAHWPLMPEEWPIIRVEVDGVLLKDIEVTNGSNVYLPIGNVQLNAGNHTLSITITNYLALPVIGERNLYVGRVGFFRN